MCLWSPFAHWHLKFQLRLKSVFRLQAEFWGIRLETDSIDCFKFYTGCNAHEAELMRGCCVHQGGGGFASRWGGVSASGWGWLATPLDCCISTLLTPARCTSLCISSTTTVQHFISLMHSSLEYKAQGIRLRRLQLEPIWIATDRILFRSNAGSDSFKLQRSRLIRFQVTSMDLRYLERKYPEKHIFFFFDPPRNINSKTI